MLFVTLKDVRDKVVPLYAMKTNWVSGVVHPLILNIGARWR